MHIIRTYSAGVHVGVVVETTNNNRCVKLKDASRVWRWRGANTLHELALHGPAKEYTRISERVPEIVLTEAIEIIPIAEDARAAFAPRWGK